MINYFQVKKAAVDIVRDLTGSNDGLILSKYADVALPSLSRLLSENKVCVCVIVYAEVAVSC